MTSRKVSKVSKVRCFDIRKWSSVTFAQAILCAWVQLHLLSKAMRVFTRVFAFISNHPLFSFFPGYHNPNGWNVISCVQLGEAFLKTYSSSGYRRINGWVVVSNIFYVHPYLGKIPILTYIFQRGWNHQLDGIASLLWSWMAGIGLVLPMYEGTHPKMRKEFKGGARIAGDFSVFPERSIES